MWVLPPSVATAASRPVALFDATTGGPPQSLRLQGVLGVRVLGVRVLVSVVRLGTRDDVTMTTRASDVVFPISRLGPQDVVVCCIPTAIWGVNYNTGVP